MITAINHRVLKFIKTTKRQRVYTKQHKKLSNKTTTKKEKKERVTDTAQQLHSSLTKKTDKFYQDLF